MLLEQATKNAAMVASIANFLIIFPYGLGVKVAANVIIAIISASGERLVQYLRDALSTET